MDDVIKNEALLATLRIVFPNSQVINEKITSAEITLGSSKKNDITISDLAVASTHLLLQSSERKYTISDFGSRNGTFVNGERLTEPQRLKHGDIIGMGSTRITFLLSNGGDTVDANLPDCEIFQAGPLLATEEALARMLVATNFVVKGEVERLHDSDARGRRLYRALIDDELAGEEGLRELMSLGFHFKKADLSIEQIDQSAVMKFPARLAHKFRIIPIAENTEQLTIAVADPTNTANIEQVRLWADKEIILQLATESDINEFIDRYYGAKLIGILPSDEKFEYLINQCEVEIGQAAHNHIVFSSATISNTHATILAHDGGYSIIDLDSTNGTFINGERLGKSAHRLQHGDLLQLAEILLTFHNPAETEETKAVELSQDLTKELRIRVRDEKTEAAVANLMTPFDAPSLEATTVKASDEGAKKEADDEDEEGKKKKKKASNGKLKAAYITSLGRILAGLLTAIVTVGLAIGIPMYINYHSTVKNTAGSSKSLMKASKVTNFHGGTFEASGVIDVPDRDAVLFVDDSRQGEVFWLQLDESGQQVGEVKSISLGVEVVDPEGITRDSAYYYIVGSQADTNDDAKNVLVRFAIDPAARELQGKAEVLVNLREFLHAKVPELKGQEKKSGNQGGLNIEGIASDQDQLLLGLRSPLDNGDALIISLKLRDPAGPFTTGNLELAESKSIKLPLAGHGIRDIHYNNRLKAFLILSGMPETSDKTDFKLWQWQGIKDQANLQEELTLDRVIKPEGITSVKLKGSEFIFIVGDANCYLKVDYNGN